jgi:hypothetical protein
VIVVGASLAIKRFLWEFESAEALAAWCRHGRGSVLVILVMPDLIRHP